MMKRYTWFTTLLLLSLLVLAGCGLPAQSAPPPTPTPVPTATIAPMATAAAPSTGLLAAFEGTLERIYTQVNPSVVNIRMVQKQEVTTPVFPEIPGFPFFGFPTPQGPQEFYRQGLGSGFVWNKEGYIVTNNHVVADADRISVTFYDGTTVAGKVVGTDPNSDLAVVKVDVPANQLQPVRVADSTQVKVGQLAIAIGNPFGLKGTMTVGFVSALGRLLPVESDQTQGLRYTIPDIIQTDAPINPGNSGGVLVDDQGRVIGVTSAIISPVRASSGIGFAIPSVIVQKVVPALVKTGHYEHPWLGISGASLAPDLAKAMDLKPEQRGTLIVDVVPGSPADKAGLRGSDRQVTIEGEQVRVGGDVIVAINGQPVNGFDDLVTYLARSTEVGQTTTLTVLRRSKEKTVKVILAARPKSEAQRSQAESAATGGAWLGILGVTITPEIAQAMNLPPKQHGVLVERVERGSPADQVGLRGSFKPVIINRKRLLVGGDIVVAMDNQPVSRLEDLQTLVQQAQPGQKSVLTLLRNGEQVQVTVTLGERPSS